jgi:hypothetical protein
MPPLDHPTPERPHRVYVAVTNHCNRSCPWCSTCSSPKGSTFITLEDYVASFPAEGPFEVQLEGGEPTIHPDFHEMVRVARAHPRCKRIVICTNGVVLPRDETSLSAWVDALGEHATVKLSINHYLLERDSSTAEPVMRGLEASGGRRARYSLIDLAISLERLMRERGGDRLFVINVRLRRGAEGDDGWVVKAVEDAGLLASANVFYLQRYGFAENNEDWERPFLAGHDFRMVNPDGRTFGTDLIQRSEAMRILP